MKNLGFIEMTENELHNVEGSGLGKVVVAVAKEIVKTETYNYARDKIIDYIKNPTPVGYCPDHGDNGPC